MYRASVIVVALLIGAVFAEDKWTEEDALSQYQDIDEANQTGKKLKLCYTQFFLWLVLVASGSLINAGYEVSEGHIGNGAATYKVVALAT